MARAHFLLLEASLARSDGRLADCRLLLSSIRQMLSQVDGANGVWCVRYREAQLERSSERLAQAHAWFVSQGVRNPERWVSLGIPGLHGWH